MAVSRTLSLQRTVLFVCTGNVCRSPMAEGLFRKMIAGGHDLKVSSAGVSTYAGQSASPDAVEVLAKKGIDISGTRSKPLTEKLVQEATWIIAMTRNHLDSIFYQYPEAAEKTYLLREFEPGAASFDIADPIGLGIDAYEEARDTIQNALPGLLEFIMSEGIKEWTESGRMNSQPGNQSLDQVDPEIFNAIERERQRQFENIELIASENFASRAVMEAQGSVLTNKYAEGYPGRRWYGGCEFVDQVERLAIERAQKLFGAEHVNVQPHSGSQANMAVFFIAPKPGDPTLTMALSHGVHLTSVIKPKFLFPFYDLPVFLTPPRP